jgi:hypothetical protein
MFGKDDEIYFRSVTETVPHAYAARTDGTGLRRLSDRPIEGLHGISKDREWVIAKIRSGGKIGFIALPVHGGNAVPTIPAEVAAWSPDGRRLYISQATTPMVSVQIGRTYVVPLIQGKMFPEQSEADLTAIPGVTVIDTYNVAPGPQPGMYAFARETTLRNLYRVPTP